MYLEAHVELWSCTVDSWDVCSHYLFSLFVNLHFRSYVYSLRCLSKIKSSDDKNFIWYIIVCKDALKISK